MTELHLGKYEVYPYEFDERETLVLDELLKFLPIRREFKGGEKYNAEITLFHQPVIGLCNVTD